MAEGEPVRKGDLLIKLEDEDVRADLEQVEANLEFALREEERQRRLIVAGSTTERLFEEAAARRFRPILMTTISTVFGVIPIALAVGAGSQSRIPLGVAVICGLIVGSLLTLFVIPAAYLTISSEKSGRAIAPPPKP